MNAALLLITGPSGVRKTAAANRMAADLRSRGLTVAVQDLEETLLKTYPENAPFRDGVQKPLVALIGQHPQEEVCSKWSRAFADTLDAAKKDNPDIILLTCSLVFYRSETFEFYSPIDRKALAAAGVLQILTLIDDVFDVYAHLASRGEVFDIEDLVQCAYPAGSRRKEDLRDLSRLYRDALLLAMSSLLRILFWREKEIDASASLARDLGVERNVLATKHPISTGVDLLLGPTLANQFGIAEHYAVYVSHPISRPRRFNRDRGVWPPFVEELNKIVAALSERPSRGGRVLTPIMPTAIDEYRFLRDEHAIYPHLAERWPVGDTATLLYEPPGPAGRARPWTARDIDQASLLALFNPPIDEAGRRLGIPLPDAEVAGMLRTLEEAIKLQMANRDHLLVRQSRGLFLYRPVYEEHRYSSGVENELHTFHQSWSWERKEGSSDRRAVFVHYSEDATGIFTPRTDTEDAPAVAAAARRIDQVVDQLRLKQAKTRAALPTPRALVAEAVRSYRTSPGCLEKIHSAIYPPVKGTIGTEASLAFRTAKQGLAAAVDESRKAALCCDLEGGWIYRSSVAGAETRVASEDPQGGPSQPVPTIYVEVCEPSPDTGVSTGGRVRAFLAGGHDDPVSVAPAKSEPS